MVDRRGSIMKKRKYKTSDVVITMMVTLAVLSCLLPVIYILAVSLSSKTAIINSQVSFWPVGFNLDAYKDIFSDKSMIRSLLFTIEITVIYTGVSMGLTIACAYPLSKSRLRGRNFCMLLILFTMYFSGGMIPDYILVQKMGFLNTRWALILPQAVSAFNVIILRTFFSNFPSELEEAAKMDGCGDLRTLVSIYLPLSMPILATLSLFYAVGKWNSFQDALFYITKPDMFPLQLKLDAIIKNAQQIEATMEGAAQVSVSLPESLKSASIIFATVPIVLVYPWLQKYFVTGIMVGSVKG